MDEWEFGAYDYTSMIWDALLKSKPFYLPFIAAGNEQEDSGNSSKNGFDIITGSSASKNVVTVGAVEGDNTMTDFSNWGPTDDGRIKPDIVTLGTWVDVPLYTPDDGYAIDDPYSQGTSYASPAAAAGALLLQEYYYSLNGSYMKAAMLKALLLHSADDDASGNGPDAKFGWGILNLEKAANIIKQDNMTGGTARMMMITTNPANNGTDEIVNYFAFGDEGVRASLCWVDDEGEEQYDELDDPTSRLVYNFSMKLEQTSPAMTAWPYNNLSISSPATPAAAGTGWFQSANNYIQANLSGTTDNANGQVSLRKSTSSPSATREMALIVTGIRPNIASWTGNTDNDWSNPNNWAPTVVPGATTDVIIPAGLTNYPTINSAAVCYHLEIESTSGSTGSLLGQVNLTVNGSTIIKRYMTGEAWHMVSSPAPGQTIESFLAANTNIPVKVNGDRGMIDYNEASNDWNDFFKSTQSGNLSGGKGFSLRTDADGFVVFEGELEQGPVSPSVTRSGFGWNCIGNPYPSAIYINNAADATNNFINFNLNEFEPSYAAVYVWEQENNAYTTIIQSDLAYYVQMGQGFFVKAKTGATQMQFATSMQTHQPGVAFKSGAVLLPEIKLIAKLDNHQSTTRIKFAEGMQKNLDIGYDAGIFKTGFDLYSQLVEDNGVDFGVQHLPLSSMNKEEISLGLDSKNGGIVVFSSELVNIPTGHEVVLEDRLTNTYTRLNDGQVYTAMIEQNAKGKGRFFLHVANSVTNLPDNNLKPDFTVYSNNQRIYVNGQVQGKTTATLYDLLGKKILEVQLEQTPLNTISTAGIKTGVYLLQIVDNGQRSSFKIPVIE